MNIVSFPIEDDDFRYFTKLLFCKRLLEGRRFWTSEHPHIPTRDLDIDLRETWAFALAAVVVAFAGYLLATSSKVSIRT